MQEEGEMVKHGKGLRYNLSQPYSTLAKVHIPTSLDVGMLEMLEMLPVTMLETTSYTHSVKTMVALVFQGTLAIKKKACKDVYGCSPLCYLKLILR